MCSADNKPTQPNAMCSTDAERQEPPHKKRRILDGDTSCRGGSVPEGCCDSPRRRVDCHTDSNTQPLSVQNLFELCRESACGSSSCGASSEGGSDSGTETESESDVSSVDYQSDLFGCWSASRKLSSGNNGQVYLGQLEDDMLDFRVALEIEKRSLRRSHLKNELEVFEAMRCVPGVPRIFDDGRVGSALWCAMELLGPSLGALPDRYTFDEDLTVFVADQMLERLEVTVEGAQTVQF